MPAAAPASAPVAAPSAKKKAGPRGKLKWIVVASVVLLAGAGGGWWFWQAKAAAKPAPKAASAPVATKAAAQYYPLDPAFVVNLADTDSVRYLQADVQLMTRDAGTRAAFETHAPAIRNRLLLLFGQQTAVQLSQRTGKEALQRQALAEVRAVLDGEGAPDKIEAVYFTSLVTQ